MPKFSYLCDKHGSFSLSFSVGSAPESASCPQCLSVSFRDLGNASFHLKGDGWFGKNVVLRDQMAQKNNRLSQKERDLKGDGFLPKLVPNVQGEEVDSWQEAKKLASSKNLDTSGYEQKILEEKNK